MIKAEINNPLKILYVSTEVAPLSKVGGLADVSWSLPRELKKLGHDVRIFTPKYGMIEEEEKYRITNCIEELPFNTERGVIPCKIRKTSIPGNLIVYLLDNQEYYEKRANVYGYSDDSCRWYLLSKMVLEFLKKISWEPDVIHINDWMTGLVSNFVKTEYKNDKKINKSALLFTIHNLNNQGQFSIWEQKESEKDNGKNDLKSIFCNEVRKFNGIKRGVIYSDIVTTVSENYSKEILTPEYGAGLDNLLREERMKIFGVINGVDYHVFNPKTDPDIWFNYDKNSLGNKVKNKLAFQKEFGLKEDPEIPLIGFVGRFTRQKGLDLIKEILEKLLNNLDFQFALVGGGDEETQKFFYQLMKKYPKRIGGHLMVSKIIGQQIYAASDIFLYPSLFEPCGLAHLIAMKYGSVPIVRKTGGLADTVENYDPISEIGNGFIFEEYNATALLIQIVRAVENYRNKKSWRKLQQRIMSLNFSWKASAEKYEELYRKAIERHQRWLKKEGLIKAEFPEEVPGREAIDHSR